MEELTVVIFLWDKAALGKLKKRGIWQYHIEKQEIPCKEDKVILYKVCLPFYERKKKEWSEAGKKAYLAELSVPWESSTVLYLYEDGTEEFLGRREEVLSEEWIFFLLRYYGVWFDALLLLEDRELQTESFIRYFVENTRYIGILTENPGEFSELSEELLSEYGFLLDVAGDIRGLCIPSGKKLLLAGENVHGITPATLPKNSVWLSILPNGGEGKRLCARRNDAGYLDIRGFLKDIAEKEAGLP